MTVNPNDELNILSQKEEFTRRAIPFQKYFAPMGISKEQKKRRIRLAYAIADIYYSAFALVQTQDEFDLLNFAAVAIYIRGELLKTYEQETGRVNDQYLQDHALQQASEIVRVTKKRINEPYFTSDDRADVIAENDANAVIGYDELQNALAAGYTHKTWHGVMDKRERDTHVEMEAVTIPIEEPFDVNGSLMMQPLDESMGASPEEIVNCRCWLTYS